MASAGEVSGPARTAAQQAHDAWVGQGERQLARWMRWLYDFDASVVEPAST
jgi:hypothetical protein